MPTRSDSEHVVTRRARQSVRLCSGGPFLGRHRRVCLVLSGLRSFRQQVGRLIPTRRRQRLCLDCYWPWARDVDNAHNGCTFRPWPTHIPNPAYPDRRTPEGRRPANPTRAGAMVTFGGRRPGPDSPQIVQGYAPSRGSARAARAATSAASGSRSAHTRSCRHTHQLANSPMPPLPVRQDNDSSRISVVRPIGRLRDRGLAQPLQTSPVPSPAITSSPKAIQT